MYYVILLLSLVLTLYPKTSQATQPIDDIPGPFLYGRLVDYRLDATRNVTSCLVLRDAITGRVSVQTQDAHYIMSNPVTLPTETVGLTVMKDTPQSGLKTELSFDYHEQTVILSQSDQKDRVLLRLECHFSKRL